MVNTFIFKQPSSASILVITKFILHLQEKAGSEIFNRSLHYEIGLIQGTGKSSHLEIYKIMDFPTEKKELYSEHFIDSCSNLAGLGDQGRMKLKMQQCAKSLESVMEVDEEEIQNFTFSSGLPEIEALRSIPIDEGQQSSSTPFEETSIWLPKACSSPYPERKFFSPSTMDTSGTGNNATFNETCIAKMSLDETSTGNGLSIIVSPESWANLSSPRQTGKVENAVESFIEYSVCETVTLSEISDTTLPKSSEQSLEEGEILDFDTPEKKLPFSVKSQLNTKITEEQMDMDLSDISSGSF